MTLSRTQNGWELSDEQGHTVSTHTTYRAAQADFENRYRKGQG